MVFGLNLGAEWKGFDFSMFWQGAAMFDVNLCGIYDSGIRDDTFYTRPFYADGNTPYIWWKALGVLIIPMQNFLV